MSGTSGQRDRTATSLCPSVALAALVVLGACGTTARDMLAARGDGVPRPDRVPVCHGYGCKARDEVALDPASWMQLAALFQPPPADGAAERRSVAQAIGLIETDVGPKTGTTGDRPSASTFNDDPGQLDCVDEAMNTTTYLRLLAAKGWLRHHRVDLPVRRGSFMGGVFGDDWYHNTAVLIDLETGAPWAVDSYFYPNGHEAGVLPLAEWQAGWRPPGAKVME